jgi:hypothetical protein
MAMLQQQPSSSLVVESGGVAGFELFRVMQWVSQGFHDQTKQCIRNGVRR